MRKVLFLSVLVVLTCGVHSQTKSYKRGVSYGFHSESDMQNFSQWLSWWYNWAGAPEIAVRNSYYNFGVDFTPMAWNASGISIVNDWVNQDPRVKYILGFNEPNFNDQARMTPSAAAAAWPSFQAIADNHHLKTVGPAVNYCGNCVSENGITYTNPFAYLDDFFADCSGCRVDYVALHWYGGGNSMASYIESARKYKKPVWVTEFASWDGSVTTLADQKKYLAGTVNFLERDPDIYRYAWFIGRRQSGQTTYPFIDLYGADGMLTELGQLYMDIPVYDPGKKFQVPGRIENEEYYLMSGLFSELTSDKDGFLNIGWTDNNDWADYKIDVRNDGSYNLFARIAGTNSGIIDFLVDNQTAATLGTPSTGSWQNWVTLSTNIQLKAGEHLLRMFVRDGGFNINWMALAENPLGIDDFNLVKAEIYPNPVTGGIINIKLNPSQAGGDYRCVLTDITGNQVYSKTAHVNGPGFQININQSQRLGPGVYFLVISGNSWRTGQKLMVL